MKRYAALILTVCLLLASGATCAETVKLLEISPAFDLEAELPEGVTVEQEILNEQMTRIQVVFPGAGHPDYTLLISPSELYDDQMMADLTEEEIEVLFTEVAKEMQSPSYEVMTVEDGLMMMVVNEEAGSDYAYVITIYGGFFIQVYVAHEDYATLTQEEVAEAINLLDSIRVIPSA